MFVADIVLTNVRHCLFKQLWIFCGLQFVFRPSPTDVAVVLRATTLQLTYLPVQGRLIVMITTLNFWKFHQYLFWSVKLLETIKTAKPIQCCTLLKGEFGYLGEYSRGGHTIVERTNQRTDERMIDRTKERTIKPSIPPSVCSANVQTDRRTNILIII